jgi:hypothetical protein
MQTIKCTCGNKICLLPDLPAMATAINNHVKTHKPEEREKTEEHLISQVIVKVTLSDNCLSGKLSNSTI